MVAVVRLVLSQGGSLPLIRTGTERSVMKRRTLSVRRGMERSGVQARIQRVSAAASTGARGPRLLPCTQYPARAWQGDRESQGRVVRVGQTNIGGGAMMASAA
jgi:hypothetical protein